MKKWIIQQACTPDTDENKKKLAQNIADVASRGAQLVILQELHNSLYFCQTEDVEMCGLAEPIPGPSPGYYSALARKHGIVLVTSLFECRAAGLYHNTAVVFDSDGSIAGKYRKMHIPDDPGYYEKFYFTPGDLGFQPIDTSVGRLGVLVCWDQWYPEAARLMALAGAELLIYPTAIGYDPHDTKEEQERQRMAWQTVQRGHAVANGLPVITVNRVGWEASPNPSEGGGMTSPNPVLSVRRPSPPSEGSGEAVPFWGTSFVAGPQGELLYEAPTDQEVEVVVEVDMQRSEQVRRWWPFLRDRRIEAYDDLTRRFIDK
jgi:N-carbamoylputrescine amidase